MDIRFPHKKLYSLKRKMHFCIWLKALFFFLAASGALALLVSVFSLFIVIPFVRIKLIYIIAAGAALSLIAAVILTPRKRQVLITADSLGLNERVITAWYLKDDTSPVAELQRRDMEMAVDAIDIKRKYKADIRYQLLITALVLFCLACAVSFFPGRVGRQTLIRESLITEMKKQEKNIEEKLNEQKEEHPELTDEQLKKLEDALERLKDEFKKARTEEDALKALAQMENYMKELQSGDPLNDLKALIDALSGSPLTSELAQALSEDDKNLLEQALSELMSDIEQEGNKQELAEILEQALENMPDGSMLSESVKELAMSAESGDSDASEIIEDISELIENISEATGGSQSFMQASGEIGNASRAARRAISSVDKSVAQAGDNQGGKRAEGQGNQSGEGKGNQSGGGQGNQPGEGSGGSKGQGKNGGQGAGEGSTSEDAGYSEGDEPGSGRAPGQRKETEYERIYVPERLGGEGNETSLSGQKLESGSSTFTDADGAPVQKGAMLPFRDVLTEYRQQAVQTMEKVDIPSGLKSLVRDYFSSLE